MTQNIWNLIAHIQLKSLWYAFTNDLYHSTCFAELDDMKEN